MEGACPCFFFSRARLAHLLGPAQVAGEEMDEATLQQVLLACLSTAGRMPTAARHTGFDDAPPAGADVPSAAEVTAAARYLVERFGQPASEQEAAEGGGAAEQQAVSADPCTQGLFDTHAPAGHAQIN